MILSRVREIMSGPASSALVLLMLAGCLFLWIGVPLGWLWIGSQVQGSASLGTAMLVTMLGITATIFVVVIVLAWLNRRHAVLQERRNRHRGGNALEMLLVASAGIRSWDSGSGSSASPVPARCRSTSASEAFRDRRRGGRRAPAPSTAGDDPVESYAIVRSGRLASSSVARSSR